MARESKPNKSVISISVACSIAVLAIILISRNIHSKSELSPLTPFPTQSYLDGGALWHNADYGMKCSFHNILVQPKNGGGALMCSVIDDDKKLQIPVILTANAAKNPLQTDQKIILKVRVHEDGSIVATDCAIQ